MQYCEFGPSVPKCHEWLKIHQPDFYTALVEQGIYN